MDAARTLLLFLYVFLAGGLFAGSAGVVELRVRAGDTVTLPCGISHQTETLWMIQRPLEMPLIAAVGQVSVSQVNKEVEEGYESRLSLVLEPSTLSVSLTLANLTESDRALYYCAERAGGRLRFGNGTELVFPEEPDRTVVSPSPSPSPSLTCWTLLPSVSVVCAIVSSVCVFSCVSLRRGSGGGGEGRTAARHYRDQQTKHGAQEGRWPQHNEFDTKVRVKYCISSEVFSMDEKRRW